MGGLLALLDDIAVLARAAAASLDDIAAGAAKASAKAAGVVVDDAAVVPKFVEGVSPSRELPIIRRIGTGSLVNKLIIILPLALLISEFAPWLLTPLLMLGGSYLCFEGAEKVIGAIAKRDVVVPDEPAVERGPGAEKKIVRGAIFTDFILSCEIMVISLNEVADQPLATRAIILAVVAIVVTLAVYGAVALLVKMDDIGLAMAVRPGAGEGAKRFGRGIVTAMPRVLAAISVIGTLAMLWVGGHIMLVGIDELGFHPIYAFVHALEESVHGIAGVGAALAWLINTACSLVLGVIWGMVLAGLWHLVPGKKKH